MTLEEFNRAPAAQLTPQLLACVAIPHWADRLLAGRPYATPQAVVDHALELSLEWQQLDIDLALAGHPRIGERATDRHSRREQQAVNAADVTLAQALRTGNQAYEARFNRVFLIRAAGRTGVQILAHLQRRLTQDAEQEWRETADQLRQITLLRLTQELGL